MTVLITNWMLSGRSGTETHVRDLVRGLKVRGHRPMVFTFSAGELARELVDQGIPVVTRLEELPWKPEVVHGHHNFVTLCALLGLPGVPGLFVCHDAKAWHDEAPAFPRLLKYAAVDEYCRERVARERTSAVEDVLCIGNSVDLVRFPSRGPLPGGVPKRALVFSNLAAEHTFLPVLREACRLRGIPLDVVGGGVGNVVAEPEKILGQYDLVFGKARCAMEALATGCATILCGPEGLGPMVTPENFDVLRRNNFGRRCLTERMEVEAVLTALDTYASNDHRAVHDMARRVLGVEEMVDKWLGVYESLITEPCPEDPIAEMGSAAELLGRLSPRLFSLYQLESENAALRHASECLRHDLEGTRAALGHELSRTALQGDQWSAECRSLKQELSRLRDERDRAKAALRQMQEKRRSSFRLAGLLATCWKRPWLRPLARILGVRSEAPQGTASSASQASREKGDTATPIPVLMGVPRSGTTLLRMMLDAHPALAIPPETGFLMQCARWSGEQQMSREAFVDAISYHPPDAPNWDDFGIRREELLEALRGEAEFDPMTGLRCFFERYAQRFGKKRWGEKTPDNLFHIHEIHRAFPEARFVHIVRDPRDVALSWRATWFAPSKDLSVLAGEWARRVILARAHMAEVPYALEIRYEDLVEHTEPTLRRVCEFLQLDFHPMMLNHHVRSGDRLKEHGARKTRDGTLVVSHEQRLQQQHMVLQPPDTSRVSAWKNSMTREERIAVEDAVGPLLGECGYGPRLADTAA